MLPTYALLTLAILALWFGADGRAPAGRRLTWLAPYVAAVGSGLATGIVEPLGVAWLGALALSLLAFCRPQARRGWRIAAAVMSLLLTAGLMLHRLPGFNNPEVITPVRFSADSIPYRLFLNFDKTSAGLLLLAFCHARISRLSDWQMMLARTAPVAGAVIALVMVLSLVIGYVRFDPKFPDQPWLWLWANLCLTCMAEEALFRGFIQAQLQRLAKDTRGGNWAALLISAVLFGLAHAGGGAAYVALATVAGAGYGWAYLRTGRIEASILTHFALNTVHFLLFTYPALERS